MSDDMTRTIVSLENILANNYQTAANSAYVQCERLSRVTDYVRLHGVDDGLQMLDPTMYRRFMVSDIQAGIENFIEKILDFIATIIGNFFKYLIKGIKFLTGARRGFKLSGLADNGDDDNLSKRKELYSELVSKWNNINPKDGAAQIKALMEYAGKVVPYLSANASIAPCGVPGDVSDVPKMLRLITQIQSINEVVSKNIQNALNRIEAEGVNKNSASLINTVASAQNVTSASYNTALQNAIHKLPITLNLTGQRNTVKHVFSSVQGRMAYITVIETLSKVNDSLVRIMEESAKFSKTIEAKMEALNDKLKRSEIASDTDAVKNINATLKTLSKLVSQFAQPKYLSTATAAYKIETRIMLHVAKLIGVKLSGSNH